jgi:hypothetical protein
MKGFFVVSNTNRLLAYKIRIFYRFRKFSSYSILTFLMLFVTKQDYNFLIIIENNDLMIFKLTCSKKK